ncbi:MAG: DUF2752 domain-containing protein [Saprospiraceae bacterium]
MSWNKYIQPIWLLALLVFPFILWLMPADYFDGDGMILCPSRLFFDLECFSCGMTRAIMHFHHFDFEEAIYYNTLVLFFYPALILIWFVWTKSAWREVQQIRAMSKTETSGINS